LKRHNNLSHKESKSEVSAALAHPNENFRRIRLIDMRRHLGTTTVRTAIPVAWGCIRALISGKENCRYFGFCRIVCPLEIGFVKIIFSCRRHSFRLSIFEYGPWSLACQ